MNKKLPQVKMITRKQFVASNKELSDDIPGNSMTEEEYINMILGELHDSEHEITRIEILTTPSEYLAFIFYNIIL